MLTSNNEQSSSVPLKTADVEKGSDDQHLTVRDYRGLAVCSIICGLSCCGIMSLIYSVKTREVKKRPDGETRQKAKEYSKKALRWGVGAIFMWVCFIVILPLVLALLSFLFTYIN